MKFLFDFDGTITSVEVLPEIAKRVGLEAEMAELTRATMQGEIPFDESFRRRVQMLSAVSISDVVDTVMQVPLHRTLMEWIMLNKADVAVVTGNLDCWVNPWAERYGLDCFASESKIDASGVGVERILKKQTVVESFRAKFSNTQVVMVGDGANDAEALRKADIGIANAIVHDVADVVVESCDVLVASEDTLCSILSRLLLRPLG